jgi:hypothetical protein
MTVETETAVTDFIESVTDERKRADSYELIELMRVITGSEPKLWGSSMVGFGRYQYRYKSGRAGEFFVTGFAPRSSALTIYVMPGFESLGAQLEKLGPHRTGKSCLYLKNLDAVDLAVLRKLLTDAVDIMRQRYECTF